MVYSTPVVTSVRPEAAPRWGSFGLTVYLLDDVQGSMLDSVRPAASQPTRLAPGSRAMPAAAGRACRAARTGITRVGGPIRTTLDACCALQGSLTPEIRLAGANENGTDLVLPAKLTPDRRALAAVTPLDKSPLEAGTHTIHVSLNGQQFPSNLSRLARPAAAVRTALRTA